MDGLPPDGDRPSETAGAVDPRNVSWGETFKGDLGNRSWPAQMVAAPLLNFFTEKFSSGVTTGIESNGRLAGNEDSRR